MRSTVPHSVFLLVLLAGLFPNLAAGQWPLQITADVYSSANQVVVDDQGNIFVGGVYSGQADQLPGAGSTASSRDIFVAKFSEVGDLLWVQNDTLSAGDETLDGLVVTDQGVFVAGTFTEDFILGDALLEPNDAGVTDVFVARLSAMDGEWDFAHSFGAQPTTDHLSPVVLGACQALQTNPNCAYLPAGNGEDRVVALVANQNHVFVGGNFIGAYTDEFTNESSALPAIGGGLCFDIFSSSPGTPCTPQILFSPPPEAGELRLATAFVVEVAISGSEAPRMIWAPDTAYCSSHDCVRTYTLGHGAPDVPSKGANLTALAVSNNSLFVSGDFSGGQLVVTQDGTSAAAPSNPSPDQTSFVAKLNFDTDGKFYPVVPGRSQVLTTFWSRTTDQARAVFSSVEVAGTSVFIGGSRDNPDLDGLELEGKGGFVARLLDQGANAVWNWLDGRPMGVSDLALNTSANTLAVLEPGLSLVSSNIEILSRGNQGEAKIATGLSSLSLPEPGTTIELAGSASNDGSYLVTNNGSGSLNATRLDGAQVTDESAGATITIQWSLPQVSRLRPDDGTLLWSTSVTSGTGNATSIAADEANVFATGSFRGQLSFDSSGLITDGVANGFVASLNSLAGNWRVSERWTIGGGTAIGAPGTNCEEPTPVNSSDPEIAQAFFWDGAEYWPVRETAASLLWPCDEGEIPTLGASSLTDTPQLHIADASAELSTATLTFRQLMYSDDGASSVDSGTFTRPNLGYSVLRYDNDEDAAGGTFVEVVQTIPTTELPHQGNLDLTIGSPLQSPTEHQDPSGRTVFVVSAKALVDGFVHNRLRREGSIFAINSNADSSNPSMLVATYQPSSLGVGWPAALRTLITAWPEATDTIVVDDQRGSETNGQMPLMATIFGNPSIYGQPDPETIGYNPNAEHAFLAPNFSQNGTPAVFAMRADTHDGEAYALLRYNDLSDNGSYKYRVYQVVESEGTPFSYDVTAGDLVPSPWPLPFLGGCPQTVGIPGNNSAYWEDYTGRIYARANGTFGVSYYYPLRADFYYDPDNTGVNQGVLGDCVQWRSGEDPAVEYRASWPAESAGLQIGETLTKSMQSTLNPGKYHPTLLGQASIEIIFEGALTSDGPEDPSEPEPPGSIVRLVDFDVVYSVSAPGFDTTVLKNAPADLAARFSYDGILEELSLTGVYDDSGLGDPFLLLNVLSKKERDRMLQECREEPSCVEPVMQLYEQARDPRTVVPAGGDADSDDVGIGLGPDGDDEDTHPDAIRLLGQPGALTTGAATMPGYVTLAFNNDSSLDGQGSPITLHIARIECSGGGTLGRPYTGSVHVLNSNNVFDERLLLRHSVDFGATPGKIPFQWHRKEAPYSSLLDGVPPDGEWNLSTSGAGQATVTISGPGIETLVDAYFFSSYEHPVCGQASQWAGDPSGTEDTPVAKLGEGWIKRVISGLNPLQSRTTDFHSSPVNTYASMISLAGEPYTGPIAFNPDADNLESVGLIETYETVLRRGKGLSVEAGIDNVAANSALLLATSKISDFYMLLGNEAVADATDPTIGFSTSSTTYGQLAPSIFAFQNQLPTLLDEELALLRGRDASAAGVNLAPVFNRLLWNFTNGEGEVAYSQIYNIGDTTADGIIDETDASDAFPQGHGDAYGHFLTAIRNYYDLLQEPDYTWFSRAEQVNVAGTAQTVDYRDERKFAAAAAARAQAGSQIADLTYRKEYVEDPELQYQGYGDTDSDRAWGLSGWTRRVGAGAYLDWVVGNALLPDEWETPGSQPCDFSLELQDFPESECPDVPIASDFADIGKIDRTNTIELASIAQHAQEIQAQLDRADAGLNPLGLAKGVVPFDIDPSLVDAGETHFEQVFSRAVQAMKGARALFDHANRASQALRENQDTLNDFTQNTRAQELDYLNQLIETFGYPYGDDIGPGGAYPSGYDGPDILHYMLIDHNELTEAAFGAPVAVDIEFPDPFEVLSLLSREVLLPDSGNPFQGPLRVRTWLEPERLGVVKDPSWTRPRRAPGEIQLALSDYYQELANYELSLRQYDNLFADIADAIDGVHQQHGVSAENILILNNQLGTVRDLDATILALGRTQLAFRRFAQLTQDTGEALAEGFPKSTTAFGGDLTSGVRAALRLATIGIAGAFDVVADVAEGESLQAGLAKEQTALTTALELQVVQSNFDLDNAIGEVEILLREEPVRRLEAFNRKEALQQSAGRFRAAAARGLRLLDELALQRQLAAADIQQHRYQDMTFRIARNDALQKYRSQFDLASKYAYLAATAYDYETNLVADESGAGQEFLANIVRERSLGELTENGDPVAGSRGLADPLAQMQQNFQVLKGQMGFNNPQTETTRFSLRTEALRVRAEPLPNDPEPCEDVSDLDVCWRRELEKYIVPDLWALPEWRRFASPFAPELPGVAEPAIVIGYDGGRPLSTTVTAGQNYFGFELGAGDSAYNASNFATKIRSVGVWFEGYETSGLSATPQVYLIPVGQDILRAPDSGDFRTREWSVVDQALPVPFPIGATDLADPLFLPSSDSLSGRYSEIRKFSSFRAYNDSGSFVPSQVTTDSRLIGRSVWNTRWLLIIPGRTLLFDPNEGIDTFKETVSDIRLFFQTYGYQGSN